MYTHTVSVLPPLVGVCGQSSDLFMDHWFAQKWTLAWYSSLCLMYSLMMGLYKFAGTYIIMYLYVFIQCVMHNCRCVFTLKCWSIICISTKYISMIRHVLHVWIIRVMNKLCMWHMYLFSCSYYFMSLQIIYVLYICKFVYLTCLILQVETVPLSPRPAKLLGIQEASVIDWCTEGGMTTCARKTASDWSIWCRTMLLWYQIDVKLNGEIDSSPLGLESWE